MNKQTEALKMAIAEIEGWIDHAYGHTPEECADNKAIQACKEALEHPTQRNFCERCGKRASKDLFHIHTCTPPQALKEKNND